MQYTDTVAEIQNTLRAGTNVKLSEIEIVATQCNNNLEE